MRVVRLYHPERRGTWLDQLKPGDYPVFVRDGVTWAERNAEGRRPVPGEPSVCLVFSELDQARAFCENKIRQMPELRCDIYDDHGPARPPLYSYGERDWNPSSKTLFWLAGASLAVSAPLFWLDWQRSGELVLATVIGINLVAASVRFMFWGFGVVDDRRERSRRAT